MSTNLRSLLVALMLAPTTVQGQGGVVIPAGTRLTVRLNEELSTANRRKGSVFSARVEKPVMVVGRVAAALGSLQRRRCTPRNVLVEPAGTTLSESRSAVLGVGSIRRSVQLASSKR